MATAGSVLIGRRYELADLVGTGGYSEVWRATDAVLNRPVVVKLLHHGYARHAETLARFRAEVRHAGSLSHVNIARVFLAGGPLEAAHCLDIMAQAAAGLSAAHLAGLVHRDIKPANLLLNLGGVVKITDFGISHAAGSAPLTSTGMIVGTPGYFAPERAAGARATPASDL